MLNEIRTGIIRALSGSVNPARGDKSGALVVIQGHGAFMEAVDNGNVYAVCNQTGVASQVGLSLATPVLTLYNPAGSGVNCAVWYVGCVHNVVYVAEAAIFVAVGSNVGAAAVTGTLTVTHRNMKIGLANGCQARPLLAATLPAIPVAIGLLGSGTTGAVNLQSQIGMQERWYNGALILKPGTNLSLQTETVSAAAALLCEYIWEEIPE